MSTLQPLQGQLIDGHPSVGCDVQVENSSRFQGKIVMLRRGQCMFIEKARVLEQWGALGGVILGKWVWLS